MAVDFSRNSAMRLLASLAFAGLALLGPAALHAEPLPRVLTVTGSGEVKAAPDRALISTGVVTEGRTAGQAMEANARAMSAVFDALERAGMPAKNIQTSDISVAPQYATAKAGSPQRVASYQVTNTVSVTVDGLDRLGATLDALVASGSNQIDGPSFSVADPKPLLAKARADAVADATAKAQAYAQAAGVALGPIQSITDGGSYAAEPMGRMMSLAGKATPVAAGEVGVSASVTITWEIR
jgi:uncharacterized protein